MNEKEIKNQICDICGKMWQLGWVAANDGNVSVKLGNGLFLATPTGMSKSFITPDKIVKINAAGEVIAGAENAESLKPSSEIKMHLRCYEERGDIGAVIHAHPPAATGYAVANKALDGYTMIEAVIAIGSVPVTPYGTPSTYEVPEAIAPYLQEHDVMLLQNHGALTVGADLITAFYRMETLELWAKISLNAHLLGGAVEISRENIDRLCGMREQYGVTGKHPGYKKYPNGSS
jgi:L-fuculose-phosphate aldolase